MTIQLHAGQRLVYQTDPQGFYVGEAAADPDPVNEGNWLIPGGCVDMAPPTITGGKWPQWVGWRWKMVDRNA